MSIDRQVRVPFARNDLQQLLEPRVPLCSHNAELGQMRPHGIDYFKTATGCDNDHIYIDIRKRARIRSAAIVGVSPLISARSNAPRRIVFDGNLASTLQSSFDRLTHIGRQGLALKFHCSLRSTCSRLRRKACAAQLIEPFDGPTDSGVAAATT